LPPTKSAGGACPSPCSPGLARLLHTPIEALIGEDDGSGTPAATVQRRARRGPVSRLEQQLDAITRLPKARQKFVSDMLDTVLAQHGALTGQEAATAS
jgi:hypothetical protein